MTPAAPSLGTQGAPARVPALIRRNTILLGLSQSVTGAGMLFAHGLGPLMVVALTGSSLLAGVPAGLLGLSRFLVAYPIGRLMDLKGRKIGVLSGLGLCLVGTLWVGLSMSLGSLVMLGLALLVFGMGINAALQLRVAAADMYPPRMRGRALGYVGLGSLLGLFLSPAIMHAAGLLADRASMDPLTVPWLILPALILAGAAWVHAVQPDPRHIGMNLAAYYPGYRAAEAPRAVGGPIAALMFRTGSIRLALISNAAAQGNMSVVMILTSLVLAHHGHSLSAVALAHMFHSIGMFGFSIPLGLLADRFGRGKVMVPGVAASLAGALMVVFLDGYWLITLGTFIVGIGWSATNIAATSRIADFVATTERGRAVGLNDTCAGVMTIVVAVITGPLVESHGLGAAGIAAALLTAVPLLLVLVSALRRSAPT